MQRYDIINQLIKTYNYTSYLEIGTQADVCLSRVECEYKVGVDPAPVEHLKENSDEFYKMTSDAFFAQNKQHFDIIFIDGEHEETQVIKDINNAIRYLNGWGTIVVHDCNPLQRINQEYPMPHVGNWNGTVWKAWMHFRKEPYLTMFVVDTDQGCGVIRFGGQKELIVMNPQFEDFEKNRKCWLNLIDIEEFYETIEII